MKRRKFLRDLGICFGIGCGIGKIAAPMIEQSRVCDAERSGGERCSRRCAAGSDRCRQHGGATLRREA